MRMHACMRIFQLMTPLIYTLKNSEKYFQNKKKKFRILDPLLKKTFFLFKGGFVPDIFAGGEG